MDATTVICIKFQLALTVQSGSCGRIGNGYWLSDRLLEVLRNNIQPVKRRSFICRINCKCFAMCYYIRKRTFHVQPAIQKHPPIENSPTLKKHPPFENSPPIETSRPRRNRACRDGVFSPSSGKERAVAGLAVGLCPWEGKREQEDQPRNRSSRRRRWW